MPRPNRVTPFGEIIATPERGTFMGNRGLLHDDQGRIVRRWDVKRWLVCLLEFRGRHRQVMTPGLYTELFFLDEATALAAGHRPCAECRRPRYVDYCNAWKAVYPMAEGERLGADEIDRQLHADRTNSDRSKRTFTAQLDELPDGVFVTLPESENQAYLIGGPRLFPWSPGGYGPPRPRPQGVQATVLTPRSNVAMIQAGYHPEVHASARL